MDAGDAHLSASGVTTILSYTIIYMRIYIYIIESVHLFVCSFVRLFVCSR